MKKNIYFIILTVFLSFSAVSQVNWSENAAQVFYDNCTSCHNSNGIAPFSLIEYQNAFNYKDAIKYVVQQNLMPPWTADSSYQRYFHERLLTQDERDILINWVNDGANEGNPDDAPPPPVYDNQQLIPATPDLTIEMPLYMSKATSEGDDYICIALPTGLTSDKNIKAIEIIPGNRSIVHHCLVFHDPTASYITDTTGGDCGGPSSGDLIAGYTPGATPTIFPSDDNFATGMKLKAGSNVIFALHYPEGSYGEYDQTRVNFYYYPDDVEDIREVYTNRLIENWNFFLPANQVKTVTDTYTVSSGSLTMMSVFPHMHLLGTYIESYAVKPSGDTVPLVRINEWDFEWQDFYFFKYLQPLPQASKIYGKGIYDNTSENPNNPSDPPVNVWPGLNTTDEMFLVYFHYMGYEEGDETINVDSLNTIWLESLMTDLPEVSLPNLEIRSFPNPFSEQLTIEFLLQESSSVTLFIYDFSGKLVSKVYKGQLSAGNQQLVWSGSDVSGNKVKSGMYYYSMLINGKNYSGKIIKTN